MTNYNKLSEAKQIELVKKNGYHIAHIKDPSEEVKLAAVKQDGWSIEYIKDPSEEVQIEAVKKLYYYDNYYDYFVKIRIKSDKAKELYFKLKRARDIMK